jgi:hypothetical protein
VSAAVDLAAQGAGSPHQGQSNEARSLTSVLRFFFYIIMYFSAPQYNDFKIFNLKKLCSNFCMWGK